MRVFPLGGAEEIGASCTLVEIGKRRVIVDCGIRTGSGATDPLPNLAALSDLGGVDAILVTHAHLDHTGGLPVLHQAYPAAPVYATPATHALIRVMLGDALKVMADRFEREQEVPLYSAEAVSSLLARAVPVNFYQPTPILGGDVGVTFFPAGHVLGAAMIGLEANDGSILFTGDYSVSPQRTVEGLLAPRFKPDVLVTESTYGDRLHANRRVEERRLAETVAAIVEGGGKALIPAFALGRAQEVILILQQFQRDGHIPRFPVWVDGMVKNICGVYSSQSEALSRDLRKRLSREGKLFFRESEGFQPVTPPRRDAVVSGGPCAIISSSGMLTGGPSLFYARRLAGDARSAILITGYQDEESPGRRLLDLAKAEPEERKLIIEGQAVRVECRVEKYGLSAHADSGEMAGLATQLSPRDVVLVHGSGDARARLAGLMQAQVHMPSAGDELVFESAKRARSVPIESQPGLGEGQPLDEAGLQTLREKLVEEGRGQALFTPEDLAARWFGSAATAHQVQQMRDALGQGPFVPDARRPFLFRPSRRPTDALAVSEPREQLPVDQMRAVNLASEIFNGCDDLYKRGAYTDDRKLVLYFHFPTAAEKRYPEQVAELARRTGWSVEIWPEAHLGALSRAVEEGLPAGWRLVKAPSYYREQKQMRAKVEIPPDTEASAVEQVCRAYEERTAVSLRIDRPDAGTALPSQPRVQGGRLEINTAYAEIDRRLKATGLVKRGLKTDGSSGEQYIELSWISPQVAERHAASIEQASREVGWPLRVNPEPNQNAIKERLRGLVPKEWGLAKDPAFIKEGRLVKLRLRSMPAPDALEALSARMVEETGYAVAAEAVN